MVIALISPFLSVQVRELRPRSDINCWLHNLHRWTFSYRCLSPHVLEVSCNFLLCINSTLKYEA